MDVTVPMTVLSDAVLIPVIAPMDPALVDLVLVEKHAKTA